MFKGDIGEQGKMLMQALAIAVKSLDRPDGLIPMLQDLGRRHAKYGVRDEHYDTVGAALIWTLEKGLGSRFTADVREAWVAVYGVVATTMKAAANELAA
jgi:hemoglobin-like flavoprotein